MARINTCGTGFFMKGGRFNVYKWCPPINSYNKTLNTDRQNNQNQASPYFCTATVGSQGVDFTNNYIYDIILINGETSRLAYIECDYVS